MSTTAIAGKLSQALGMTPTTGNIGISWPDFTDSLGNFVPAGTQTVFVAHDGSYSFHLVPTYNSSPYVYYTATYRLASGHTAGVDKWAVPSTTATLTIAQIRINQSIPPPAFLVQLDQLYVSNANVGDVPVFSGTTFLPVTVLQSYTFTFTGQSNIFIPATMHGQGAALLVQVYDSTGTQTMPLINVVPGVGDVTISFGSNTTGSGFITGGLGRSLPNFAAGFVGTNTATIPQSQHRFATNNLAVAVYDASGNQIQPGMSAAVQIDSQFAVHVSLGVPQTFTVVIVGAIGANTGNVTPPSGATPTVTVLSTTATISISEINDGTNLNAGVVALTGATLGMVCAVNATTAQPVGLSFFAQVVATNQVQIQVFNDTGGDMTPGSTTFKIAAFSL